MLKIWLKLAFLALCLFLPAKTAIAATSVAPVAVFPLQDMSRGRNGINFPFTRYLVKRLEESGTEVCRFETVIAFMSNNRIRFTGQLETYHVTRIREELGAAYILLGTVIQNKDKPKPSLGLTLNLIRTNDGSTVWTYVGAVSGAEDRKLLGIGEAKSARELEPILADEIMSLWPDSAILNQEQQSSASIDSVVLQPKQVVPGTEVHCTVRLRNLWLESRAPRLFLKADDQIYAATYSPVSNTYEASWIAGKEDGRYPVTLVLEWPLYGRTETVQLGYYLVDGVAPVISLNLRGEAKEGDPPVFRDEVIVVPIKVIRKPIDHWHISFRNKDDVVVADQKGRGELPEVFIWRGRNVFYGMESVGLYEVHLDVWDVAGNKASASNRFELNRRAPKVELAAEKEGRQVMVDVKHDSKVPLAFWRLEMWSKEGKLLKQAEGKDLPAQIGIELPSAADDQDIEGTLLVQDILGNKVRRTFDNLLRPPEPEKSKEEIMKEKTATKAWVEEF